jgi:hypothetical protein
VSSYTLGMDYYAEAFPVSGDTSETEACQQSSHCLRQCDYRVQLLLQVQVQVQVQVQLLMQTSVSIP